MYRPAFNRVASGIAGSLERFRISVTERPKTLRASLTAGPKGAHGLRQGGHECRFPEPPIKRAGAGPGREGGFGDTAPGQQFGDRLLLFARQPGRV
jgi:hypothetical protein